MSDIAPIYKAAILRAVHGRKWHEHKVHDAQLLNDIVNRLAESEEAMGILRANGYGKTGMTLVEIVRSVPSNVRGLLSNLFTFKPFRTGPLGKRIEEPSADVHDIWTSR